MKLKNNSTMKPRSLRELSFKYKQYDFNTSQLVEQDVFSNIRVLWSIALYVLHDGKHRDGSPIDNPLLYCFGDLWSRSEYEIVVSPWTGRGEPQKLCVYDMYIKPNAKLFMDMVNSVTKTSARAFYKEYKDTMYRRRKK